MKALANKISDMFLSVTENFSPLPQQNEKIQVPVELLATVQEVQFSLKSIKLSKSVGPVNLPNKVLKEFALELATVIQDIYNQSLIDGYVPQLLRCSIISPIPKENPPQAIEKDLRPISLTCTLAKVMEGLFCRRFLPQLEGKIDKYQFARKGLSTTDALIRFLQPIHEAIDKGDNIARIFFTDFPCENQHYFIPIFSIFCFLFYPCRKASLFLTLSYCYHIYKSYIKHIRTLF